MATVKNLQNEAYGNYFEIENKNGVILRVSPAGARALDLVVPAEEGARDLLVGFKTIAEHQAKRYYAATIGPVAGRIAGAKFELDGTSYQTEANEKGNTLHGGSKGYDTETWQAESFTADDKAGVIFSLLRKDGASGFPGNVETKVTYSLDDQNNYQITYDAKTDKKTLFNPTNHGYYNLTGSPANAIDQHTLEVRAENVAATREDVTTTGEKTAVGGTKFDFIGGKKIGATMLDDPFILDHNSEADLILTSPDDKVKMTVKTTEPAIVIYTTGSGEAGTEMKHGTMTTHGALAIEPQGVPGTEIYPQFGDITLTPEKAYHSETSYHLDF